MDNAGRVVDTNSNPQNEEALNIIDYNNFIQGPELTCTCVNGQSGVLPVIATGDLTDHLHR